MEASLAATGMLEVLATRAVLFMMDSSTPPISILNCRGEMAGYLEVRNGGGYLEGRDGGGSLEGTNGGIFGGEKWRDLWRG